MININETIDDNEYIYLTFPTEYNNTLIKVIYKTADIGKEILDDCNVVCSNKALTIMKLWNALQAIDYSKDYNKNVEIKKLVEYISKYVTNSYTINQLNNDTNIFIPERYVCTYHKVLNLVATVDYKEDTNICDNKFIIKCILSFNSAIANYHIKNYKLANLLINYVNAELKDNKFTKDLNKVFIDNSRLENNKFKAIVSCCGVNFDVSSSTGRITWSGNKELVDSYFIEDGHLKVKYGNNK